MAKKTGPVEKKVKTPARLEDLIDQVKAKALEIYRERQSTGKPGDEISDWVAAEKDIKVKHSIS